MEERRKTFRKWLVRFHHSRLQAQRTRLRNMIPETVAGDFGRFDYAATGNKVVGCAWLTSLLQLIHYRK